MYNGKLTLCTFGYVLFGDAKCLDLEDMATVHPNGAYLWATKYAEARSHIIYGSATLVSASETVFAVQYNGIQFSNSAN